MLMKRLPRLWTPRFQCNVQISRYQHARRPNNIPVGLLLVSTIYADAISWHLFGDATAIDPFLPGQEGVAGSVRSPDGVKLGLASTNLRGLRCGGCFDAAEQHWQSLCRWNIRLAPLRTLPSKQDGHWAINKNRRLAAVASSGQEMLTCGLCAETGRLNCLLLRNRN